MCVQELRPTASQGAGTRSTKARLGPPSRGFVEHPLPIRVHLPRVARGPRPSAVKLSPIILPQIILPSLLPSALVTA